MVELDRRRLTLDASVMVSKLWVRPALLPLMPRPFGMISDSCSHASLTLFLLLVATVPSSRVLKGERGERVLVMVPVTVESEMVTLMPLTPEMADRVSQSLDASLLAEVGEAESMLSSALPRSLWALLVIGEEIVCTSKVGCLDRRCGMGNLNLLVPPIVETWAIQPNKETRQTATRAVPILVYHPYGLSWSISPTGRWWSPEMSVVT